MTRALVPAERCELTAYAELAAVLEALPMLVREARRVRRLSMRAAGAEIGCAASTLMELEAGTRDVGLSLAVKIVVWLGGHVTDPPD